MTDWTDGYVADIGYTFGYYPALNPLRARLALLNAGLCPPESGTHCELGFGQGMSVNIHAAASGSAWYANDFNPAQAGFAQTVAQVCGANAQLTDESFADFCIRPDLPSFDSIGLHGIWSWISDENRSIIVDFIRRKLKIGGVLYVSYNTQPGWAAMSPMRDLLLEHKEVMGVPGNGIAANVHAALAFAENLMATNPKYSAANPHIKGRVEKLKDHSSNYLAHEYFNRNWQPMSFAATAKWLAPAKLNFACSANYLDHIDAMNLSAPQQVLLKGILDPMFRESVRDFMVNQSFRRDYWVKGARKLNDLEQAEALRSQQVMLLIAREDVSLKVKGAVGEATMQAEVYGPILDVLADHKPKTIGQLEHLVKEQGVSFAQVLQAMIILTEAGYLAAVQDNALISKAKQYTEKFNAFVIDKARGSAEINLLASPVTGGGITVDRFHQLFLLALSQGKKQPFELGQFAWGIIAAQGQKIAIEGKTLETPEDGIAALASQATTFMQKQWPILKALQIA